jgi:hypothetical protein
MRTIIMDPMEELSDEEKWEVEQLCEEAAEDVIGEEGFVVIEPNAAGEYIVVKRIRGCLGFQPSNHEWELIFKNIRMKLHELCEEVAMEISGSDMFRDAVTNAEEAHEFEASFTVGPIDFPYLDADLYDKLHPNVIFEYLRSYHQSGLVRVESYELDEIGCITIHLTL